MDEDAALFGLALPDINTPSDHHFEVFKDNWPILEAFFVLDGCAWQYTGMGDLIGLGYSAAQVIWGLSGIHPDTETFRGLMLFARTVVDELNKRKKS